LGCIKQVTVMTVDGFKAIFGSACQMQCVCGSYKDIGTQRRDTLACVMNEFGGYRDPFPNTSFFVSFQKLQRSQDMFLPKTAFPDMPFQCRNEFQSTVQAASEAALALQPIYDDVSAGFAQITLHNVGCVEIDHRSERSSEIVFVESMAIDGKRAGSRAGNGVRWKSSGEKRFSSATFVPLSVTIKGVKRAARTHFPVAS
jgi:hypothetical protein